MAIPKGKQRITITVSDESVDKLAFYGEKMGMNRSALCAYLVGQGLMGLVPLFVVCNFFINVFVTAYSMIQKCEYFKNFL